MDQALIVAALVLAGDNLMPNALAPAALLMTNRDPVKTARRPVELVEVSGRVLYNGKPLPGGRVTFVTADGFASTAVIDETGNYRIKSRVGEAGIGVDNRMLQKRGNRVPGRYVQIPAKYSTPDTSGLKYKVRKGQQTGKTHLQILAAQVVTSLTTPSLVSVTTHLLTVKRFQDAFALGQQTQDIELE